MRCRFMKLSRNYRAVLSINISDFRENAESFRCRVNELVLCRGLHPEKENLINYRFTSVFCVMLFQWILSDSRCNEN